MLQKRLGTITKPTFSFEIFPPKGKADLDGIFSTIDALASLSPDFISVTYGAGGSSRDNTVEIASAIQTKYNIPALAHLTCVGSKKEDMDCLGDILVELMYELKESNHREYEEYCHFLLFEQCKRF